MPSPYSILYVDDEPDLLDLAKAYLEESGEFSIDTKGSAEEALQALRQNTYDAIASDFQMPGMDGIAFLKEVRSSFGDIPFIIFTGRGREEVAIEALNNGADFYLQKGGEPEAVYTELIHVLKKSIQMREAQATIAQQEQRYHDLQNANDMIQSVAPDGRFLFVNQKWQDTLGYREDELGGITLFDIIHEESRDHCMTLFPRVLGGENVGIIDVVFKARDGRKVYVEGLASCKLIDGKPQYTRGIFKDVTDRKKAEASLKESEEKFRTLVEYTLDGILILDPAGTLLFANLAAGQIVETEHYQEMFGVKNVLEFIAAESQNDVIEDFARVAKGDDGYPAQYKIITAKRRERWVESIGKSIVFEGRPAILISLRDITARRQADTVMRENESKFRAIFENSPYPIAINSMPDQKFLAINSSFLKVSGYTEEEILGKNPVELGLLSVTETARLVSRAVLAGKIENVPLALTAKAGKRIHVIFSTIPITISGRAASMTITAEVTQLKRVEEELIQRNEDLHAAYEELTATDEELRANYDELHKQEQALRESEEKFRALVETSPDMIWEIDMQSRFRYVSPMVEKIMGYSPEEVIGKSVADVVTEQARPLLMQEMTRVMSSDGVIPPMQFPASHRDGHEIIIEIRVARLAAPDGTPTGFRGMAVDITERKRSEDALRESEEKFRALVEYSLDGIIITDFTGKLLFANQAAGRIVGAEDYLSLIGKKSVMDFVAPESREAVFKDFMQVAQGIDAYLVHYKLIAESKKEVWVECIGKKIVFGGTDTMLVSMRDVTERRIGEEKLRESEKKFSTIFQSSPFALTLVSGVDGTFVDVNDAFIQNSGYTRDEVIGKTSREIGIFADMADYNRLASELRSQRAVRRMEIRCRSRDGTVNICRFSSTIVHMEEKVHILSIVEDITSQKETEEALNALVRSMVGATGLDSFQKITENVASWLGADCVMVSELAPDRKTLIARSMILDGKNVPGFTCLLSGTPCNTVAEKGFSIYPDSLSTLFPDCKNVSDQKFRAYIGTPLLNSAGVVTGVLSVFFRTPVKSTSAHKEIMDIIAVKAAAEIERSHIEQTLRESEEKFRMLVEHSLDGILILDMTGKILFSNRAAAEVVDADSNSTERIGSRNALEIVAPEGKERLLNDIQKVAAGSDSYPVSYPAITLKGRRIWVEGIGKMIHYRNAPAILVSMREITSRKQMEDAILRTNKQLNLLSSITRHDVLNKIAVIQGHIALARKKGAGQDYPALMEKVASVIEVIRQQVEFTRVYQSLGTKEPEWQQVKKILSSVHLPGSLQLRNNVGEVEVYADRMLEKVFQNMVDNTIRHGGKVTEIRLESTTGPEGLTITFEDDGIGIPDNEKEKIFARGYGKNTGLGLFLAREILNITNITIRETGEAGKGARFEIHVPENTYRLKKT